MTRVCTGSSVSSVTNVISLACVKLMVVVGSTDLPVYNVYHA